MLTDFAARHLAYKCWRRRFVNIGGRHARNMPRFGAVSDFGGTAEGLYARPAAQLARRCCRQTRLFILVRRLLAGAGVARRAPLYAPRW